MRFHLGALLLVRRFRELSACLRIVVVRKRLTFGVKTHLKSNLSLAVPFRGNLMPPPEVARVTPRGRWSNQVPLIDG